eukprot:GHVU01221648.1.p1 GENE.GHVU01221648.1~~GHVU01221648.1.p1  ORF type:complete len:146 (+),score=11.17 GHVU01221648.1:89-526(+)
MDRRSRAHGQTHVEGAEDVGGDVGESKAYGGGPVRVELGAADRTREPSQVLRPPSIGSKPLSGVIFHFAHDDLLVYFPRQCILGSAVADVEMGPACLAVPQQPLVEPVHPRQKSSAYSRRGPELGESSRKVTAKINASIRPAAYQ